MAAAALANELGLDVVVSHLPPGTSKWHKIEHRLFCFISQNWRAKPLVSYRVIVVLISATTTKTGLTVRCELVTGQYPSVIVVSDPEMSALNLKRAVTRAMWNDPTSSTSCQSNMPSAVSRTSATPPRLGSPTRNHQQLPADQPMIPRPTALAGWIHFPGVGQKLGRA